MTVILNSASLRPRGRLLTSTALFAALAFTSSPALAQVLEPPSTTITDAETIEAPDGVLINPGVTLNFNNSDPIIGPDEPVIINVDDGNAVTNEGTLNDNGTGSLTLNSDLVNESTGVITKADDSGTLTVNGDVTNSGTMTFEGDAGGNSGETIVNGDVEQTGTGSISAGGTGTITGTLTNSDAGTEFTVTSTGDVTVEGGVENTAGTVTVEADGTLSLGAAGDGDLTNGGTLDNAGTIEGNVASSGTGTNSGEITGTLDVTGGTFGNSGTVGGDTSVSAGTLTLEDGSDLADDGELAVSGTGTVTISTTAGNHDSVGSIDQSGGNIGGTGTLNAETYTQSGGSLDAGATISVSDSATLEGGTIDGTLTGAGDVTATDGVTIIGATGEITQDLTIDEAAEVQNAGTLAGVETEGTFSNTGTVDGTLTITGGETTNSGSVTGATTISDGTLTLEAGSDLSDTEELAVDGGTVTVSAADTVGSITQTDGTIDGTDTLTAATYTQSGGTLDTDATIHTTGAATLQGGTIAGTLEADGGATVETGTTVLSGSIVGDTEVDSTLELDGGDITGNLALNDGSTLSASGDTTLTLGGTGVLTLNGANTIAAEDGVTLDIAVTEVSFSAGSSQTYGSATDTGTVVLSYGTGTLVAGTREVEVAGGTLQIGSSAAATSALGVASADTATYDVTTTVAADATVDVNGFATIITGLSGAGTITNDGAADAILTVNGTGDSEFSGVIEDGSSAIALTKENDGTLTLSGENTYSGDTNINGGAIALEGSIASDNITLDGGDLDIAAGGTLTGEDGLVTVTDGTLSTEGGAFSDNYSLIVDDTFEITGDEAIIDLTGAATGSVVLDNAANLTVSAGDGEFAGVISGDGSFTLTGGETTLSGVNTYTGGTLVTAADSAIASVLTVTGEIGDATVEETAELINEGTVGDVITNDSANFDNSGTAGTVTANGDSTVTNSGTTGPVTANDDSTVTNEATGIVASLTANDDATVTSNGEITGALEVNDDAKVTVEGAAATVGSIDQNGGTLTLGSGALVEGTTDNSGGDLIVEGTTTFEGAVSQSAGSTTISGDSNLFAGGLDVTGGTVEAEGNLTGAVTLSGEDTTFTLTSALSSGALPAPYAGDSSVTLTDGATLEIGNYEYTGLTSVSNTDSTINIGESGVLGATTTTNAGTILLEMGTIDGALVNTADGILNVVGSGAAWTGPTVTGTLTNDGTVSLANGSTGDVLNIGGLSGSGIYALDLDLSDGTSDSIVNSGGGAADLTFDFSVMGSGYVGAPIQVYSTATGTVTSASTTASGGLPVGGVITYELQNSGNSVEVVSSVNTAVAGIASGAAATQSLINAVVNRPTSPFVSGLAAEEGCSSGGYVRGTVGVGDVDGQSTSEGVKRNSSVDTRFSGVQAGYDWGCFDGRFFDGWDGAIGFMVGYNSGSTKQDVFGAGTSQPATGRSDTDFDQNYVGIYLAGSKDRISGDLQLRTDRTEYDLSEIVFDGGTGIGMDGLKYKVNSTTIGARFNYRFDLNEAAGVSFVPTVGVNYTQTGGDTLTFAADDEGNYATMKLNDYDSVIGFVGGTVTKTTIAPSGTSALTYFASGNYYHDFDGERTADVTTYDAATSTEHSTRVYVDGIGGFAEASIGVNYVQVLDNGPGGAKQVNANVRADARFGDNVRDSYSLTAQVRLSF